MPPRNETAAPAGAEHSTLYVAIEIRMRKSGMLRNLNYPQTPHPE